MPSRPANGARMGFCLIVARMASALPWVCLSIASTVSRSACEIRFWLRSVRLRTALSRANSSCASSARSWASSKEVSSRTSRSPLDTTAPDSNAISCTRPAISGVTVTPWTAVTEPMAVSVPCHFSSCATAAETDSGGGAKFLPAAISFLIWSVFTPARTPTTRSTMKTASMILRVMSGKRSGGRMRRCVWRHWPCSAGARRPRGIAGRSALRFADPTGNRAPEAGP